MLQFICPYCEQTLRVPRDYAGKRGKCKKCGARIALVGNADTGEAQWAARVDDEVGDTARSNTTPEKATQRQLDYLRVLGAWEEELVELSKEAASEKIERLKRDQRGAELPTEEQLAYLRRLGLSTKELLAVGSKEEASFLIERLQPAPTENQIQYLQRLGARPEQIRGLKTRGEAAMLIEKFLSGGFREG